MDEATSGMYFLRGFWSKHKAAFGQQNLVLLWLQEFSRVRESSPVLLCRFVSCQWMFRQILNTVLAHNVNCVPGLSCPVLYLCIPFALLLGRIHIAVWNDAILLLGNIHFSDVPSILTMGILCCCLVESSKFDKVFLYQCTSSVPFY